MPVNQVTETILGPGLVRRFVSEWAGCCRWLPTGCPAADLLAFPPAVAASPLAGRPYDLRHACLSAWLNSGVDQAQVAEWAGNSVAVLLRTYVKCIAGRDEINRRRIEDALRDNDLDDQDGDNQDGDG